MGHQAVVIIHLDALDSIENDPEFGKKLAKAIKDKANFKPFDNMPTRFNASSEKRSETAGAVVVVHDSNHSVTVESGQNTGKIKHKTRPVGWGM